MDLVAPAHAAMSAPRDRRPGSDVVEATAVPGAEDGRQKETEQERPDRHLDRVHPGSGLMHLETEQPVAHRRAEGPDEQEILQREDAEGNEGLRAAGTRPIPEQAERDDEADPPVDEDRHEAAAEAGGRARGIRFGTGHVEQGMPRARLAGRAPTAGASAGPESS